MKEKSLHPLQATLVLVVFLAVFGIGFWAYDKSISVETVDNIKRTPWQTTVIRMGNHLYEYSDDETLLRDIDINRFGFADTYGDFAFLSQQQLLINVVQHDLPGLHLCDLSSDSCRLFSDALPLMARSFHIDVDRTSGDVFVTHASEHKLYRLNSEGAVKETLEGFRYPNKFHIDAHGFWLADTNHHHIKHYVIDNSLTLRAEYETSLRAPYRWPFNLLKVDDEWWVNIMDNGMRDGRIIRYDQYWRQVGELSLPSNADPYDLDWLDGNILITDLDNQCIYRFDQSGRRLENFEPSDLQLALQAVRHDKQFYWSGVLVTLGVAIVLFIMGMYIGVRRGDWEALKRRRANFMGPIDGEISMPDGLTEYWLVNQFERYGRYRLVLWLIIPLLILAIIPLALGDSAVPPKLWLLVGIMIVVLWLIIHSVVQAMRSLANAGIGIAGDKLLLKDHRNRVVSGEGEHIRFNQRVLVIEDVLVIWSSAKQNIRIYDKEELQKWVVPRLKKAQQMSEWEAIKLQLKLRHPAMVSSLYFIVGFTLLIVCMKFLIPGSA